MLFFFLFKQKTAYDMRISDWSSDVCSSDLRAAPGGEIAVALIGREIVLALHAALRPDADPVELVAIAEFAAQHVDLARRQIGVAGRLRIGPALHEIGRASCRERVFQYV